MELHGSRSRFGSGLWGWAALALGALAVGNAIAARPYVLWPMAGDYTIYRAAGIALLAGQYPDVAVPPLFPLLMEGLARLAGIGESWVVGQVLSLLSYAAGIPALYLVCRDSLGRRSVLAVAVTFLTANMLVLAHAAVTDILFLALALWTVRSWQAGRAGLAWVFACLACLTRTEGLLFPAALAVAECHAKQWARSALLASAAVPGAIWTAAGTALHRTSAYQDQVASMGHSGAEWLQTLVVAATRFVPGGLVPSLMSHDTAALAAFGCLAAGVMLAAAVGLRTVWREHRALAVFQLTLVGLHTALHMWFAAAPPRYAFPILWAIYMWAVAGVLSGLASSARRVAAGTAAVLAVHGLALLSLGLLVPARPISVLLLLLPVGCCLSAALPLRHSDGRPIPRYGVAAMVILALGLGVGEGSQATYTLNRSGRGYAELIPAADVLRELGVAPSARVVADPTAVKYLEMAGLDEAAICPEDEVRSLSPSEFDRLRIRYGLWDSTTLGPDSSTYGSWAERAQALRYRYGLAPHSVLTELEAGRLAGWSRAREVVADADHRALIFVRE
jgi:hypothetical protein